MKKLLLIVCALLATVGAWAQPITEASQISANKCYTVTTPSRGSWTMNTDGTNLVSSKNSTASSKAADGQWAFVKVSDNTYLYNVGAQKFIVKNGIAGGANASYGTPIELYQYQSTEMDGWGSSANYDTWQNEGYIFNAKFGLDGNYPAFINFGSEYNTAINGWGPGNAGYNEMCGADAGNSLKIEEVADFDPTAILEAINSKWNITSSDLSTNFWTALGDATPAGVTALGNYTPYVRTQDITLTSTSYLNVKFLYSSGSQRLDILGIDLLNSNGDVVASDYHVGYTGTYKSLNTYQLLNVPAGSYKLRYIIAGGISNSVGNIYLKNVKLADSFANISQWYLMRAHSNQTHYMYYNSEATTGISFADNTNSNSDSYLWGFVQSGDGVQIFNKAAGSGLALDNATPSTMSADGTSLAFHFAPSDEGSNGLTAGAHFALYQTSGSYLNYQSGYIKRWSQADAGSTFMVDESDFGSLNYVLTDMNGAKYQGTYEGFSGVTEPTITGCYGYTLSNKVWDGATFTATITFPFNVSSNGVTNWVNISNYNANAFYWYVKDGSSQICVTKNSIPTNVNYLSYEWAIIPAFSEGAFTFTINSSKGGYITSTEATTNSTAHNAGIVTVTDAATTMTYTANGWLLSTSRYLSVNSSGATAEQNLGAYPNSHNGTVTTFKQADDFSTLLSTLQSAYQAASAYPIAENTLNKYWGDTASEIVNALSTLSSQATFTAAELTSLISTLENPASKLTLNIPQANTFLRIRSSLGANACLKAAAAGTRMTFSTNEDKETIFLYSGGNLIAYTNGLAINNVREIGTVGGAASSFTFVNAVSGNIGQYSLGATYNENTNYLYSTGVDGSNADRNTLADNFKQNNSFTLEAVTSLPVTISSAGYATLYAPVALSIPEGVTAYIAEDNGKYLTLTAIEGGIIPAETGVILKGEAGSYNFDITTGGSIEGNALTGTITTISKPTDAYYLSNGKSGIGFYKEGSASTMAGFKAYYQPATGDTNTVKTFRFADADGIDSIENGQLPIDNVIYNVAGQRLNKLQRGVNIIGGKKIIVK